MNTESEKLLVFISWAGTLAQEFAESYKSSILQLVGDYVEVFLSKDIPTSTIWRLEILEKLKQSNIGIVIVTPDSVQSSWVKYEIGALEVSLFKNQMNEDQTNEDQTNEDQTNLVPLFPLLVGINKSDLALEKSPIVEHQCQTFDSEENDTTIKLLQEIIETVLRKQNINYNTGDWEEKVTEEGEKLHDRLKLSFDKWNNELKIHLPKIELVDYNPSTQSFGNFVNKYTAFNAPLVHEQAGENATLLQAHIDRYCKDKVKAEYFYPIFALLEKEALEQWLYNIHWFFQRLAQELKEKESSLPTFYVPRLSNNKERLFALQVSYNTGFTFFLNETRDDSEKLVYIYMHNGLHSTLAGKKPLVRKYFVIRNPDDFHNYERFIIENDFRTRMDRKNLREFLQYCEVIKGRLKK